MCRDHTDGNARYKNVKHFTVYYYTFGTFIEFVTVFTTFTLAFILGIENSCFCHKIVYLFFFVICQKIKKYS